VATHQLSVNLYPGKETFSDIAKRNVTRTEIIDSIKRRSLEYQISTDTVRGTFEAYGVERKIKNAQVF